LKRELAKPTTPNTGGMRSIFAYKTYFCATYDKTAHLKINKHLKKLAVDRSKVASIPACERTSERHRLTVAPNDPRQVPAQCREFRARFDNGQSKVHRPSANAPLHLNQGLPRLSPRFVANALRRSDVVAVGH
jgi:hypothetical protein